MLCNQLSLGEGSEQFQSDKYPGHDAPHQKAMVASSQDRMDELSCAICLNLLCEPVLWPAADDAASPCRHVYCRHCVVRCILSPSGRSCPLCRAPATSSWIECAEDLPIEFDVQRQVMDQFPSEHAERQVEVAEEARASGTQQVLLHTVHSNPLQLRPRKGSFVKLWLRSTDETLFMVAAALTTPSRRLGICLDAQAAEGAAGCFVSVVGYGRHEYTFARAVTALLRCRRQEDGMIRVKLQVGDPDPNPNPNSNPLTLTLTRPT